MSTCRIVEALKARLVEDARDVWRWWTTWLYLAIAIAGAVAAGLQAMPQEFQDCVSMSFPRWVLIGISVIALFGPFLRVLRQGVKDGPSA